jgi:heme/copper-type cytochrome/quinol oxidase subunit 4
MVHLYLQFLHLTTLSSLAAQLAANLTAVAVAVELVVIDAQCLENHLEAEDQQKHL